MGRRLPAVTLAGLAAILAAAAPVWSDAKGEALLRGAMKKLHAARTYRAQLVSTALSPGQPEQRRTGTISAMKPNYLRVEIKGSGTQGGMLFAADGKKYTLYSEDAKQYRSEDLAADPKEFQGQWEGEVDAFFGGDKNVPASGATHTGTAAVDGVDCDLVKIVPGEGRTIVYAIGKTDGLIHQTRMIFENPNGETVMTNTLTGITLNAASKAADFAFIPPAGARALTRPNFDATLIPVGKPAPDFQLPQPGGQLLSLEKTLKEKKAVLINFWFYN